MRTSCVDNCGKKSKPDLEEDEGKGRNGGSGRGRIAVVGIGPGDLAHLTVKAKQEIECAEVIVSYRTYLRLIQPLIREGVEVVSGTMGREVERARTAVMKALEDKRVVVVSSGDPGIYGMAGLVLEVAEREKAFIPVEVVPGVTAANAAASTLGAPLIGDFAVISLSDLLTPWSLIERRLRAAAEADFVIALYNPKSKGRKEPLAKAYKILLEYRSPETLVGIVKGAMREGQETTIKSLKDILNHDIDMVTIVIIGNSTTYNVNGKMVTPRGYKLTK